MQSIQPLAQLIIRFWQHLPSRRRRQFGYLLVLMILAAFAEVLSIGAVLPFLGALTAPNRIFEHSAAQPFIHILGLTSADQLLLPLIIVFGVAALMAGGLRLLLLWASVRLSFAVGVDLSVNVYRRTLYQPYAVHIARNSSEVINGITAKVGQVIFSVLMPALILIGASTILTVVGIAILSATPIIAVESFCAFGLLYALIIRMTRNRLMIAGQLIASESTHVIKCLQEGLGGIRDILIDGTQDVSITSYRDSERIFRRAQGNTQIIAGSPRYVMEASAMLLMAMLAYLFAQEPDGIGMAIPMLAAMALGMQRLLPALQQVYGSWSAIRGAQASLQDTLELLDQPLPDFAEQFPAKPVEFQHQIKLKHISFRYSLKNPWVFKNIDLVITKGSCVGFVGSTGGGKSTLLDIIMGLLEPTEGVLEIDDQPITTSNLRSWQANIAHVPQAIFLADSTIEENIAFGVHKNQIDYERVRLAARQAQLADTIETWPDKYQTSVGERGVQLSGGQRQRIGIARALYKQADVIIFDEATSALDSETEEAVMQAIESLSGDLTILIIAHRIATLRSCTKIVSLSDGGILSQDNINNESY